MSIITQISRENNISAEIYVSRTVEDACPYNFGLSKHPYENLPNRRIFFESLRLSKELTNFFL